MVWRVAVQAMLTKVLAVVDLSESHLRLAGGASKKLLNAVLRQPRVKSVVARCPIAARPVLVSFRHPWREPCRIGRSNSLARYFSLALAKDVLDERIIKAVTPFYTW